jgi:hypothetical protein
VRERDVSITLSARVAELLVHCDDALHVCPLTIPMRRGFLAPGVSAAAHGGVVTEAPLLSALPHGLSLIHISEPTRLM